MWYRYVKEYYLAKKTKEILPFVKTWNCVEGSNSESE